MKAFIAAVVVLMCASICAVSAANMDSLLVYGNDFMFSLKAPAGWSGDTEHASSYGANIILYRKASSWQQPESLIRILIADKTDEYIDKDLIADMDGYKRKYPLIQFQNFSTLNPKYRTYSKLFMIQGQWREYVAYVNPGPRSALMFSVSMNESGAEISQVDLAAFRDVVSSLVMLKAPQQVTPADRPLAAPAAGD